MTFLNIFILKTYKVLAYQKSYLMNISRLEQKQSHETYGDMPIPVLTPWYVYGSSHESVFYNNII